MSRPARDLTDVLRRLAAVPVTRHTVRSVLDEVADQAADLLEVPATVSITVVADGPARTVAASDPLAARLDSVQYGLDAGPCLEAARTGGSAGAVAGDEERWPRFTASLRDAGCDSVWSAGLPVDQPTGSLNLYLPAAAEPGRRSAAAALVDGAVVPVMNVWLYEESLRTSENLRVALESRAVIEQAKGILMERLKVTADQAFDALVRVSNDTNTKLRDVALAVVETGAVPPGPPTRRSPAPR